MAFVKILGLGGCHKLAESLCRCVNSLDKFLESAGNLKLYEVVREQLSQSPLDVTIRGVVTFCPCNSFEDPAFTARNVDCARIFCQITGSCGHVG
jgi:hypothetical protein